MCHNMQIIKLLKPKFNIIEQNKKLLIGFLIGICSVFAIILFVNTTFKILPILLLIVTYYYFYKNVEK